MTFWRSNLQLSSFRKSFKMSGTSAVAVEFAQNGKWSHRRSHFYCLISSQNFHDSLGSSLARSWRRTPVAIGGPKHSLSSQPCSKYRFMCCPYWSLHLHHQWLSSSSQCSSMGLSHLHPRKQIEHFSWPKFLIGLLSLVQHNVLELLLCMLKPLA